MTFFSVVDFLVEVWKSQSLTVQLEVSGAHTGRLQVSGGLSCLDIHMV